MGHEDPVEELPGQEGSSGLSLPERDCLAADMTREAIIEEYPSLCNDAIRAAFAYSADLDEERIVAA
jgi:hypothetical protein